MPISRWRVSVLLAWLSLASLVSAQARQRIIVTVAVFNDAGVSNPTLLEAEKTASLIYDGVGVMVVWNHCDSNRETNVKDCLGANGRRVFLRLHNQARTIGSDVYGVAFLDPWGKGEYCDVFYNRVAELYHRGRASQAKILAIVMAHELGHLLLGSHAHSETGIMRPRLQEHDFWTLDLAATTFTNQQRKKLSENLSQGASLIASEETRSEVVAPRGANP